MARDVALPYRTDWRQMAAILDYAKGKGVDRAALEARFGAGEAFRETCNGLEQLGLIDRDDTGSVSLTDAGRELAYAPDARRQRELLLQAMLRYAPYRMPLERALANQQSVIDGPWVEHIWQIDMRLAQPRNRAEEARTVFFRLADDAGLGIYRRGVRGQTTRFELHAESVALLRSLLAPPPPPAPPAPEPASMPVPVPVTAPASAAPAPAAPTALGSALPAIAAATTSTAGSTSATPATPATPDAAPEAGPGDAPVGAGAGGSPSAPVAVPTAPTSASTPLLPGLPAGLSVQVDITAWDIDKIAAFLHLIGYPVRPRE